MRRSLVISLVGIVLIAVVGLGATLAAGNHPLLGLDLQGGASVVLKPVTPVSTGVLASLLADSNIHRGNLERCRFNDSAARIPDQHANMF